MARSSTSSRRSGAPRRRPKAVESRPCDDVVMSNRPAATEYPAYAQRYVDLVPEEDIIAGLEKQGRETALILRALTEEKAKWRYAPEKWSIKTVVRHFTDAERVFGYRALAIARGDKQSLPGFAENEYAAASDADQQRMRDLADEY